MELKTILKTIFKWKAQKGPKDYPQSLPSAESIKFIIDVVEICLTLILYLSAVIVRDDYRLKWLA